MWLSAPLRCERLGANISCARKLCARQPLRHEKATLAMPELGLHVGSRPFRLERRVGRSRSGCIASVEAHLRLEAGGLQRKIIACVPEQGIAS